jgi:gliding motility associated protien GldN
MKSLAKWMLFFLLLPILSKAQSGAGSVALPDPYPRQADIFWRKYDMREIDLNEKMNLPFKDPKQPLAMIIQNAAMTGDLRVYDPDVEYAYECKHAMPLTTVKGIGRSIDSTTIIDPVLLTETTAVVVNEFSPERVLKFRIYEEWYFDEATSTRKIRIAAIAPIMEVRNAAGDVIGQAAMYWIRYEDIRPVLANYMVRALQTDVKFLSWADVFDARLFSSYITYESNVFERTIASYSTGVDAHLESDRVQNELFNQEHDVWSY